ncbi:MAG: nucleotidyltransferase domain-containing protein [bacterium]|uniref:Nucleotidyltransferase domain-containing protein n=1 Tax=Candidatus Methylomirabilis tolerans TaxID=3123416 RepID=A0AAJ1AJP9_9BACT|nr:nucleotidyltransferase domain-containing protein [Candidatus Methylomirabilis sp.]
MEAVKATPDTVQVIRRTIEHLQRRVLQAVLFGSHARGEADAWSDVDLAVISPDFARMSHRQVMDLLVETVLETDPSVEIRPYTPSDLREARPTNFLGHILAEGKVVYRDGEFFL